jgi:hypothetical protein
LEWMHLFSSCCISEMLLLCGIGEDINGKVAERFPRTRRCSEVGIWDGAVVLLETEAVGTATEECLCETV